MDRPAGQHTRTLGLYRVLSASVCVLSVLINFSVGVRAQPTLEVDYQYKPAYWYSAIGLPADHHKPLVDESGALLYDFGPGPYVRPGTRIGFELDGTAIDKQGLDDARIPIVKTVLRHGSSSIRSVVQSYTLPPMNGAPRGFSADTSIVRRIGGLTGTNAWADPGPGYDPAFSTVAWGTNRPITYEISVPPGESRRIALGFCESYRSVAGLRNLVVTAEGAEDQAVDPIDQAGRNVPFAVLMDAHDTDNDGLITVEVLASAGDPNVHVAALWVFPASYAIDVDALIRGSLNAESLAYVDAGNELQRQELPSRFDIVRLSGAHGAAIRLAITSRRNLTVRNGVVFSDEVPFIRAYPEPTQWIRTESGINLAFSSATDAVDVVVQDGHSPLSAFPSRTMIQDVDRVRSFWLNEVAIPYDRIQVPDHELQEMLNASIRTVYQMMERVDGYLQAQPGAALYRGAWMHDSVYFIDLIAQLGDTTSALELIEGLSRFQHSDGQLEIMRPNLIHRETPLFVWLLCRYAELTNDDTWLEHRWESVSSALDYIRTLREQTLVAGAPNYGLTPAGFADGGIHGVQPEYASVNWILIALPAAVRAAKRLGHTEDAEGWQSLYDAFLDSWKAAARRDIRRDSSGNAFLPVRVGATENTDVPQRAQWTIPEALSFGSYLSPADSLVVGTFRMLERNESEGLVASVGWLDDGIWVYYGGMLAEAYLRAGDGARAAELLYAMANHASPVFTWPEEQMRAGTTGRTAGDYPHAWASSTMPRLAARLLAFEDGDDLTLLRGMPTDWLSAGAQIRLSNIATRFGGVDLNVDVSADGRDISITVGAIRGREGSRVSIDWTQMRAAGFVVSDDSQPKWGSDFSIVLHRY